MDALVEASQAELATLATHVSWASSTGSALTRGDAVGRYLVLEPIGRGATGTVHAAYDPELDRKIAIKLLHRDVGAGSDDEPRHALIQEAQALAKLSHPNVVAVHDVGVHERRVFLAMEFVVGRTLRAWLDTRPHWRAVVTTFVEAGRGLAAAHAVGLVHRDFKPDNAMLGDDGRVRVMDFGLARATEESTADGSDRDPLERHVAGTPAYMAPELHGGSPADARSDQFAFCVALWEGLYGARPFRGASVTELVAAVCTGRIEAPIDRGGVPQWLRRVVERGIAADPAARFPDMTRLLAALEHDPTRARRRWAALAGVLGLAAGGAVLARVNENRARAACEAAGDEITQTWNADVGEDVAGVLAASGSPIADDTRARIVPMLDDYVARWSDARTSTCTAAIAQPMDAALERASIDCFEDARSELEAVTQILRAADAMVVLGAVAGVAELPPLDACADPRELARRPPRSSGHDDDPRYAEIRGLMRAARSATAVGRHDDAEEPAIAASDAARELGYGPLLAEAQLVVGMVRARQGRSDAAAAAFEDAFFAAGKSGADGLAADAAIWLVDVEGDRRARVEAGLRWAKIAEMQLARIGEEDSPRTAWLLTNEAATLHRDGRYDAALEALEQALALAEARLGNEHPRVGSILIATGHAWMRKRETDRGLAAYSRALAIKERTLGPRHPEVAGALGSVANVHVARGELEQAMELYTRVLGIQREVLGPAHVEVSSTLSNIANVHRLRGQLELARPAMVEAIAIQEGVNGPEHPDVARLLQNLGVLDHLAGANELARDRLERALAVRERTLGKSHPEVAGSLANLAAVYAALDRNDAALAALQRALAIREQAFGADHPSVAELREDIAELAAPRGEPRR
jgi:tetratricopeptide (TPR) repeat protein